MNAVVGAFAGCFYCGVGVYGSGMSDPFYIGGVMRMILLFAFMFVFFFGCSTPIDCYEDKNIDLGKDIKVCLKKEASRTLADDVVKG